MRKVCAKSQCRLFAKSIDTLKRRCYNVITTQKRTNLAVYRKQALMKRFIAIAATLSLGALCCALSGCSAKGGIPADAEVVRISTDRAVYSTLDELEAAAELVIIGRVSGRPQTEITREYSEEFGRDIVRTVQSTVSVEVEQVLRGEDVDKVEVSQRCGYIPEDGQLVTASAMTPMERGGRWIMFLYKGAHSGTYWCAGDSSGRYPLPNDGLDAAVCAVQSIADGRDKLFAEHTPLSESEMDAAAESGLYIMPNGGEFYALSAQELEQYLAIEERIAQETGNISPEDFDVYESADIDLMLYKDILDEYGIA